MRALTAKPPSIDAFVRTLYGLLAERPDFGHCLLHIGDALRAHIVVVQEEDLAAHQGRVAIRGALEASQFVDMSHEYANRWAGQNLWVDRCAEGLVTQGFQDCDAVVGDAELLASPYYRHFLKRIDIRHGIGITLMHHGERNLSMLSVNRPGTIGAFQPDEIACVRAVQPHLANAYALARRFHALECGNISLKAGLDRLPFGALLLDSAARVVDCNIEASRLLDERRGIRLDTGNRLHLTIGDQQVWFDRALSRLAGPRLPASPELGIVGRTTDQRPLVMCLHALPSQTGPVLSGDARIIAFLYDLDRSGDETLALHALQIVLGLTPMEARIALAMRLLLEPERVATALNLAPATVRTHLKSAFRKSGARKQAELTRLVDRIAGLTPAASNEP